MKKLVVLTLIIGTISTMVSCKDKKEEEQKPDFNKGSLLSNVSSAIILPALTDFQNDVNALSASFSTANASTTTENIEALRHAWKDAYLTWQTVKIFDFGPIRNIAFKSSTGTYPSDTAEIATNISNGTYDLASAANVDAIGFSALDYLFYNYDADNQFATNSNYRQYVGDVIAKIKSETDLVVAQWGSYASTFNASTGTESTSAFSLFVNEYNRDFELAKNAKLGIPIGKQSLGIQLPEYLEARYSKIGLELFTENIHALYNVFNGVSYNGSSNGVGFDDYLNHLDKSALTTTINTKYTQIIGQANSITTTMEEAMASNPTALDQLYVLMQGQVVNIKTDMTSAFGVLITYADNDGD